jgi:hypothetical protein
VTPRASARSTHGVSSRLIGEQQAEGKMYLHHLKAIGMFFGVSAGALTVSALSAPPAHAWTFIDLASAAQCTGAMVNDAGSVVGFCGVNDARQGFLRELTGRSSIVLAPLVQPPCIAEGISNGAAGAETIVGWCADANGEHQAVFWNSATPTTAPTLLQPLSILGVKDKQTGPKAVNASGVIVGDSLNNNGTKSPVVRSSTGAVTELPGGLLESDANCVPVDINDAATPSIIGNCPSSSANGANVAVLWASATSGYSVLPVPSGGACSADKINDNGQILGDCAFADDSHSAVLWAAGGGSAPTVLTSVGGAATRTVAVDINNSGLVAGNYLSAAGFIQPYSWNTAGGGTNASAITPPGGTSAFAVTIGVGGNGEMVGFYKTTAGVFHPFHVVSGSTSAVDDGTPQGGPGTIITSISKGGLYKAAVSEDTSEHTHTDMQSTP